MLKRTLVALASAGPVVAAAVAFGTPSALSQAPGECDTPGAVINGNAANNVLVGTPFNDVINGGDGNDQIDGRGGHDVIRGGDGNDRIRGGDCDDLMRGGRGDDRIDGQNGLNDTGNGDAGVDVCSAATENQVSC
ncbi:MAG: calcium-binding protein [Nocardioides sp.]